MQRFLKAATAIVTAVSLVMSMSVLPVLAANTAATPTIAEPSITAAPATGTIGAKTAPSAISGAGTRKFAGKTALSLDQKIKLLQQRVKYVFVIFQENRAFDHYFGTYPGVNGLFATFPGADPNDKFAAPANSALLSQNQFIANLDGTYAIQSPFLLPRNISTSPTAAIAPSTAIQIYPEDLLSVDHSHGGYINAVHADAATKSITQNDGYALNLEGLHFSGDASTTETIVNANGVPPTANPSLATKQKAEVVMGHLDCDTIPFLWQYADRFALFDNFHQTTFGPSTPNAIAMIAAQTGDTQWVLHGANGDGTPNATKLSVPNEDDTPPFAGGSSDTAAVKPPFGPDDTTGATLTSIGKPKPSQANLTFASLPLSFMGNQIKTIIRADQHPEADLADVQRDIRAIAAKNRHVNWGWYQQGYGPEPFDGHDLSENSGAHFNPAPEHASYIVHHNGPQYFGYLGDNTSEQGYLHSLQQFYTDMTKHALPAAGGVFYVRGGYFNNDGLIPLDPNPVVQKATPGNDDHPNYSDSQISEAMVADTVNAIAASPYWSESAIIITYDESDGFFDHQPEQIRTYGPDGQPETGGPRIPTIVISPYAATHVVSHVYSEHASVVKFINALFNLTPLSSLPDEVDARKKGATTAAFNKPNGSPQADLGPADGLAMMGDLTEAFDNDRLASNKNLIPASYAMIATSTIKSLPHYAGEGCKALGITPTDFPNGHRLGDEIDPPPTDFNPRPSQSPGVPYLNTNGSGGAWDH